TRFSRDWSSDVCSSDLEINEDKSIKEDIIKFYPSVSGTAYLKDHSTIEFIPENKLKQGEIYTGKLDLSKIVKNIPDSLELFKFRSEERRVGKECRCRRS